MANLTILLGVVCLKDLNQKVKQRQKTDYSPIQKTRFRPKSTCGVRGAAGGERRRAAAAENLTHKLPLPLFARGRMVLLKRERERERGDPGAASKIQLSSCGDITIIAHYIHTYTYNKPVHT